MERPFESQFEEPEDEEEDEDEYEPVSEVTLYCDLLQTNRPCDNGFKCVTVEFARMQLVACQHLSLSDEESFEADN